MSANPFDRFERRHDFLVGIDSDGCAFDTMEVKHKECFIPNTIRFFDLQPISKFAREAAEFVNLYSKWRGINRFPALTMTLDLLRDRPDVTRRGVRIPRLAGLVGWLERESKLGMPALKVEVARTNDADLARTYEWSQAVNEAVDAMVRGVPPFPFVRESLDKLADVADVIVCSATPGAALKKEWEEHGIASYAAAICGQEVGSKKEILAQASKAGYESKNVLMIGDAPGDFAAAKGVGARFFPINPGVEDASWERFFREGCDRFLAEAYSGDYESGLVAEFEAYLPEKPPWGQHK
ncbi:MAG TPA: HAD family hydrolase [Planctomycetaceae bacterium]|nr:HAD family hydrolase [Planctomycetaceae bacterium]